MVTYLINQRGIHILTGGRRIQALVAENTGDHRNTTGGQQNSRNVSSLVNVVNILSREEFCLRRRPTTTFDLDNLKYVVYEFISCVKTVALVHFLTSGVCWRDRVSNCDGYGGNVGKGFTLVAMVFPALGVR